MEKIKGITVVSPMWGPRTKTDRMVYSVIHQFISKNNPFNIQLVLVDDYIEARNKKTNASPYDYYLTKEFKKQYDTEHINITLIKNKTHKYQGESREIGYLAGTYDYFLLLDCDDMLAPNACDRFLGILNNPPEEEEGKEPLPIACIYGLLYSFDTNGYENNIIGQSIWVQGRCYNRNFIKENDIHFPTGLNSKQGEDYPFIRKFDYALEHCDNYQAIGLQYNQNEDCQATAYWFPNEDSLSRQDPHYGQHLSGWTMASSNAILDFFDEYNKKHKIDDSQDEFMKHEYLNMVIYSFYNLLDFIAEISMTDYIPLEEDWYSLRDNVKKLRNRLKEKYWNEIVYSDIEDMLYQVRHYSDVRFIESWIGTFYDYVDKEETPILSYDYQQLVDYAHTLEFDGIRHEQHAPYVQAWIKRHPEKVEEDTKTIDKEDK